MAQKRAPLLVVDPVHPEPHRVRQAVKVLRDGEVLVYPTDTIYGLGVDLEHRPGIERLYRLRKLDPKKPLALICSSLSEASRYATINDACFRYMRRVLPGPYTFVLKAGRDVPKTGDAKRRSVGIRIPEHPVALAIVAELGHPILTTSAIRDDAANDLSDPVELAELYGDGVAMVLDAGILGGTPSSVIDWSEDEPRILRRGAGDLGELEPS